MTATASPPGELEPIETASIDELRALQLGRLRWSLRHAYQNVPYYRDAFDAAAIHPDDVRDLADLARFPFTTKASLRDNYPFGMFAVPRGQVARVHASSGTTGRPTVVGYTAADIDTWATVMARSIRAAGGRPGHIVHVAYGYGLFTGGLGAHYGAERLGCTVVPVSGGAGQDFPQRPEVAVVGSLQGGEVGRPLLFKHDDRRIAEPHQEQVQQQAAGTAVPVDEGVDLLEAVADGLISLMRS